MGFIYKAVNKENNKVYIGQSIQKKINLKISQHKYDSKKGKSIFLKDIKKFGVENFEWKILIECEDYKLDFYEERFIEKYNTFKNGYNSTKGGKRGYKRPDASKRMKENNPMKNLEIAKKVGLKNSLLRKGKTYEEIFGIQISNKLKKEASKRMKKNNPRRK